MGCSRTQQAQGSAQARRASLTLQLKLEVSLCRGLPAESCSSATPEAARLGGCSREPACGHGASVGHCAMRSVRPTSPPHSRARAFPRTSPAGEPTEQGGSVRAAYIQGAREHSRMPCLLPAPRHHHQPPSIAPERLGLCRPAPTTFAAPRTAPATA